MTISGETAIKRGRKLRIPGFENVPWALFFREFCKNPAMIGSIIPSSNRLIERMLDKVDWPSTKLFVEYGPGVGTFTRPILDRLPQDATLLAIDTNRTFIKYLARTIPDVRLTLVHGSAADLNVILGNQGLGKPNYILSGLPFSTLPQGMGPEIVRQTHSALKPGGAFVTYQYSSRIQRLLSTEFVKADYDFELINIPPVHVIWSWKEQLADLSRQDAA